VSLVCDLYGNSHVIVRFEKAAGTWRVETSQQYAAAETERMMKLRAVLNAMAEKVRW
jgi:hypothetical protein